MCHFENGIAKASVALGALQVDTTRPQATGDLSVPFGFNIGSPGAETEEAYAPGLLMSPSGMTTPWRPWQRQLFSTYPHGHDIYGNSGIEQAWSGMVHPFKDFTIERERESLGIPRDIQQTLDDDAMQLKLVHQRALNELRETVSEPLDAIEPPLAIYLQAFLGHLFCPTDGGDTVWPTTPGIEYD